MWYTADFMGAGGKPASVGRLGVAARLTRAEAEERAALLLDEGMADSAVITEWPSGIDVATVRPGGRVESTLPCQPTGPVAPIVVTPEAHAEAAAYFEARRRHAERASAALAAARGEQRTGHRRQRR